MSKTIVPANYEDGLTFDVKAARGAGEAFFEQYNSAEPFPHIAFDNFLPPAALDKCLEQFPKTANSDSQTFDRDQERLKTSYQPDHLSPSVQTIFHALNSRPMLQFLEGLTGIKGLIPDPYFLGGGFHEIKNGGHLSIHADFNHHKILDLERRINLLVYLNKDWDDDYGGQLELWSNDMSECVVSVRPDFNKAVVFNTTQESNHGNPNVVANPHGQSRKSIALYYYTATWDGTQQNKTTQFRMRKGSDDRRDMKVASNQIVKDFLPPVMFRHYKRFVNKLTR